MAKVLTHIRARSHIAASNVTGMLQIKMKIIKLCHLWCVRKAFELDSRKQNQTSKQRTHFKIHRFSNHRPINSSPPLQNKEKNVNLWNAISSLLEILRPDTKRQELPMRLIIPVEAVPWRSKENTTTTRSFYSPGWSWFTWAQNLAFLIWTVVANSSRIPQKTHSLPTIRDSSLGSLPTLPRGCGHRFSGMLGNGSHMDTCSSLPFWKHSVKSFGGEIIYTATFSC